MVKERYNGFLNTPPLWENQEFDIAQFEFPMVDIATFEPEPIPTNLRLGHQMEYVFKQLITQSEAYEILVHNLPIRAEKQTLGEIDFILKHQKTQELIHVELTYKFYLIDQSIAEPIHQLVGPNRHDAFYAKMQKIKNHQFKLLHSKECTKELIVNNINATNITHQCCFKAQLFQPYNAQKIELFPLNKNCIVGFWLHIENFKTSEFEAHSYYIPTKSEWALAPHQKVEWHSYQEIVIAVEQQLHNKRSPMLWLRKSDSEFEKLFVVWWNLE